MLRSTRLFVLALAIVYWAAASATTEQHQIPWEFARCGQPSKRFNERLICILDPAQTEALRHDDIERQVRTCRDITGRHASTEIVRKCLYQALRLRQRFVEALPVDQADVPYRLSPFERLLLQNYAGSPLGVLNMMTSGGDDAVRAGLRRVFTAIMPGEAKQDVPISAPQTASDFIENAFGNGATLEADRYFTDSGAKIHDGSRQGMFVIDLETGDMTMASISAQPEPQLFQLFIW